MFTYSVLSFAVGDVTVISCNSSSPEKGSSLKWQFTLATITKWQLKWEMRNDNWNDNWFTTNENLQFITRVDYGS